MRWKLGRVEVGITVVPMTPAVPVRSVIFRDMDLHRRIPLLWQISWGDLWKRRDYDEVNNIWSSKINL